MHHTFVVKDFGTLSLKTITQFLAILALTVVKTTQLGGTLDFLFFLKGTLYEDILQDGWSTAPVL